jgi:c-di-GMP-binding flagellar brake protein YcgR
LHIDEIAVGGSIEIEVVLTGKALNFKSEVVLIKHHSILINSIKFNDQTVGFSDKYKINFLYKHEGKLYKWENVSIKLVRYDGGIYHKIDLAGEGQPYNRREYFRLYIGEEMPIYINTASGATALSVLVKDISESGVGFITKEDIDVDRTIRLKLKSNNSIISLSGVIVRKEYLENIKSNLYGCKFYEKNNALGKYIAKRQNELIKKRLSSPATKANMSRVNKTGADKKVAGKK